MRPQLAVSLQEGGNQKANHRSKKDAEHDESTESDVLFEFAQIFRERITQRGTVNCGMGEK